MMPTMEQSPLYNAIKRVYYLLYMGHVIQFKKFCRRSLRPDPKIIKAMFSEENYVRNLRLQSAVVRLNTRSRS